MDELTSISMDTTGVMDIPHDVIILIAHRISIHDRVSLSLVCKQYQRLIRRHLMKVERNVWPTIAQQDAIGQIREAHRREESIVSVVGCPGSGRMTAAIIAALGPGGFVPKGTTLFIGIDHWNVLKYRELFARRFPSLRVWYWMNAKGGTRTDKVLRTLGRIGCKCDVLISYNAYILCYIRKGWTWYLRRDDAIKYREVDYLINLNEDNRTRYPTAPKFIIDCQNVEHSPQFTTNTIINIDGFPYGLLRQGDRNTIQNDWPILRQYYTSDPDLRGRRIEDFIAQTPSLENLPIGWATLLASSLVDDATKDQTNTTHRIVYFCSNPLRIADLPQNDELVDILGYKVWLTSENAYVGFDSHDFNTHKGKALLLVMPQARHPGFINYDDYYKYWNTSIVPDVMNIDVVVLSQVHSNVWKNYHETLGSSKHTLTIRHTYPPPK